MLSTIAEDGDKAFANLQYDLWYNGVLDPMVNSSLELPSVETEIPVVLHAADGTGSIRRQLVLVNPAQYPCEPMEPETDGCSNQNAKTHLFSRSCSWSLACSDDVNIHARLGLCSPADYPYRHGYGPHLWLKLTIVSILSSRLCRPAAQY